MITLTATALAAVRTAIARSADAAGGLRIMASGVDRAGPRYFLRLEREASAGDMVVEQDGVTLFIDGAAQLLAKDLRIDFVAASGRAGFVCGADLPAGVPADAPAPGGPRWH